MSKYIEIIIISCVAIAILYITFLMQQTRLFQAPTTSLLENPDAFGERVTIIEMNEQGTRDNSFSADTLVHYPYQDTTRFTHPHFTAYPVTGQPWHALANYGQSSHGMDKLTLWGQVKIQQPAGPDNKELTLITSLLTLYPQRDFAETDRPVLITDPHTTVNAIGMRAYLQEKRVQLLAKTRGVYDPPQQTQ